MREMAGGPAHFLRLAAGALCASVLLAAGPAAATRIAYLATDLPDPGPEDLWQYEYFVSEESFGAGVGFSILFPVGDTAGLVPVATGADADWDVIVLQPEPLLASPGRYDAQARLDGASLLFSFVVRFLWSGEGDPGSQTFEIYDPSFAVVETGQTVPIPEPGTALLLALGLATLTRGARRA
jgi:hypothetical protein